MNKEYIINESSKEEFMRFVESDNNGEILKLLDDEGISILNDSPLIEERINYILAYSKYKNELFKNNLFLETFIDTNINNYYANLNNLKTESYDLILNKMFELETYPDKIAKIISYFNKDYILNKLDNWPYGMDMLYRLISSADKEVVNKIINIYNIDLSDKRINISSLARYAKQTIINSSKNKLINGVETPYIHINTNLMTKELAKKIYDKNNIFKAREIINDLSYSTDTTTLNNYIKKEEDSFINNSNEDTLYYPYNKIYEEIENMHKYKEQKDIYNYNESRDRYRTYLEYTHNADARKEIENSYNKNKLQGIYEYLEELSNRSLSNYIIDYHFEENFHNIMIDINELLGFYYDGNVVIKRENISIYEKIRQIDMLSVNQKKELHEELKKINIKEIFYDDMSFARNIVKESIKDYSLTKESLKNYKDEKLSKEYGIDVYRIEDDPFFGIVRSNSFSGKTTTDLPTGHSYSLIGNDCLATFKDPDECNTYLYDGDSLNPNQIVHVFPYDSFTMYKPFEFSEKATRSVFPLMMPEEITGLSATQYSEILVLEEGSTKTELDKDIPKLKEIALYCKDEITKKAVDKAKEKGIGIFLVSSKKYFENKKYYEEKYKYINGHNYRYLDSDSLNDIQSFESTR